MSFAISTIDDNHEFMIALAKALLDDPDVSQGSFGWLWLRTIAGGSTNNDSHLANVLNDLLPDTTDDDMADRWGTITGVPRKTATPARKSHALRVFGAVASPVPIESELTHTSGLRFEVETAAVVGAGGFVDVDLVAIDTGSQTRLNAGETLTFVATPAGLADDAELQLDLDEDGVDLELIGPYRARILARFSTPPLGGAQSDYVQWALQQVGIAAAYCYPIRQGLGSVDLSALHSGSGSDRLLLTGEVTALKAAIDKLRPVAVTFRVLTVFATAVNVEYTVLPDGDAQSEFDWTDSTPPEVNTWDAPTRKITFVADRPADMTAGMRISIKPALGGGTGEEFVIEELSSTNAIILETAPALAPANLDTVYSGGPLTQPIRVAIQAVFDGLGTANPDDSRYGTWDGNVRPGSIDRASRSIAGVLDGTVVEPNAVVQATDPPYPDDATIELLTAGRILVRRAH